MIVKILTLSVILTILVILLNNNDDNLKGSV